MLISYPVLPTRANNESEDAYLDRLLTTHVNNDEGRYPVSTLNTSQGQMHRWHGGVHLIGSGEPIRAIADGTVVAYRFTQSSETYDGLGRYDTSFVLIRHSTETGENTSVSFYSLYMHLASRSSLLPDRYQQLTQWMRDATPGPSVIRPTNLRVWRKDVLGFAGVLYEREACHMEVFASNTDLNQFWRDSSSVTQGAGSEDFFGDAHFVIPAERNFAARHPRAATTGAHRIDFPGNSDFPLPEGTTGQNSSTLYVSIRLEQGRRTATTFVAQPDGQYVQLGAPIVQDNYEYELYRLANALYPDCPSAGLEWLRFGRVLGPDVTTRNENWQLVRYSDTNIGYVDLAPNAIAKLSDADFVYWQGWEKREEGQAANASDGICDDQRTIALCQDTDGAALSKVRHLVCKSPSEWDASDLAARYGHLREPGGPLVEDSSWAKFVEHVQKMAFWADTGLGDRSVWHFHPMQFIHHFRKSAWLSNEEFRQLQPSHAIRTGVQNGHPAVLWEQLNPMSSSSSGVPVRNRVPLNKMARKYGVNTCYRMAAFFGNALQETAWISRLSELGGSTLWYAPWYGRGFLQLTNPDNFSNYWAWRGRGVPENLRSALVAAYSAIAQITPASTRSNATLQDANFPALTPQMLTWRADVQGAGAQDPTPEQLLAPSDSAGFYWVKLKMAQYADEAHVLERRAVTTSQGQKVYYRSPAFWRASAAVNLPGALNNTYSAALNGFDSRCSGYGVILAVLTETRFPSHQASVTLNYPEGYTPRRP